LFIRLFQHKQEYNRPRKLTKALLKADDKLVPKFLDALRDTKQQHVVRILVPEGLITGTSVMLYLGSVCVSIIDISQITGKDWSRTLYGYKCVCLPVFHCL